MASTSPEASTWQRNVIEVVESNADIEREIARIKGIRRACINGATFLMDQLGVHPGPDHMGGRERLVRFWLLGQPAVSNYETDQVITDNQGRREASVVSLKVTRDHYTAVPVRRFEVTNYLNPGTAREGEFSYSEAISDLESPLVWECVSPTDPRILGAEDKLYRFAHQLDRVA